MGLALVDLAVPDAVDERLAVPDAVDERLAGRVAAERVVPADPVRFLLPLVVAMEMHPFVGSCRCYTA